MQNLSKKNYSKNGNYWGVKKQQQEKKHQSATSHELPGAALHIFMVSKIWQEMNTEEDQLHIPKGK